MQFVINNPYRILGLTANASSREVAKRVADLETFAEFGKIKKYGSRIARTERVEKEHSNGSKTIIRPVG